MPARLQGKIAIITGSSSGIGRATALAFSSEGATVVCADIREEPRPEHNTGFNKSSASTSTARDDASTPTHTLITQSGGKALYHQVDMGDAASVEALVARAVKEYGRLDIMFSNAGIAPETNNKKKMIWEIDEETWDKTMRLNAKGVMLGCKYAAKQMISQEPGPSGDRGWIVNTASIYGLVAGSGACEWRLGI
jgi:NAD(P)-dependent dehydrogenase (short-subunit alcohol dehydrogenase family)